MRVPNLIGQRFGLLTVVSRDGSNSHGRAVWLCQCDCGNKTSITTSRLTSSETKSCGCPRNRTTHGDSRGHKRSRLFGIYHGMKNRCFNKNMLNYSDYGGRGISVCPEWRDSYEAFKTWALSSGYKDSLTLDRIDNDGDYCPTNCRWTTRKEQGNNKRTNLTITFNGRTQTAKQWAEELGVGYSTIVARYHKGWDANAILFGR